MRKLLVAAIVATLGLARAADPSASATASPEQPPAAAKDGKAPGRKARAKTAAKPATAKPAAPASAAKPEPAPPAKAPGAPAAPCEPVKPCSIDG